MYSKEFKNLVEQEQSKNTFIGIGNPNSKILIVGKEVSNSDDKPGIDFYNKNCEYWKSNIENNIQQCDVKNWTIDHNPLFAYKGLTKKENKADTWRNYQKLYDIIFEQDKNANNKNEIDFQKEFFITEMSDLPSPKTVNALKNESFNTKLNNRKNTFFRTDFIQKFDVVILACSNYIWNIENDWQINDIFNVTFDYNQRFSYKNSKSNFNNTFWVHYNKTREKLIIHSRQLSNGVDGNLLKKIGVLVKQHLKNL